jgi:hypothetical protein
VKVLAKRDGVCGMREFSGSHGSDGLYQGTTLVGPLRANKIWASAPALFLLLVFVHRSESSPDKDSGPYPS